MLTPTRQVLPLLITFIFLGGLAWVGYQIYLSFGKIQDQARKQMGTKVVFSKDGVRVNVKDMGTERYQDKTQSWFVKAWNLGTTPEGGGDPKRKK